MGILLLLLDLNIPVSGTASRWGGMATEILVGFLGCLPFQGLLDFVAFFGERKIFLKIANNTFLRYPVSRKVSQNHSLPIIHFLDIL